MKQRKRALAAGLILTMLANGAAVLAAIPAAQAAGWDEGADPYTIDWVVKYEENFDTRVVEPSEWVRDTYEEQKDEFWGDFGYAEQQHYAQDHGASLEVALAQFGAYRKSYSFGQDNWLTIETYARNAGDDPDTLPESGGRFIINGDGKAVMVCEKHTDAAIIGSTNPLPSTYRLEVTVKNIDVGGLNQDENGRDVPLSGDWNAWTREEPNSYVDYEGQRLNGYFTESSSSMSAGPWVGGDASSQNGMYFLGIVDYGNPRPQNNTFIHYHRKLAFDTDNNGHNPWSYVYTDTGEKKLDGSRYISMLFLDANKSNAWTSGCEFFSITSKDGGTAEHGATMLDKYIPGEEYTFAVIRTPESYTMEVTGNFYYAGQHTYTYTKPHVDENAPGGLSGWTYHFNQTVEELQGLIPPTAGDVDTYMGEEREDWPADAVYPDYFYFGIPHINFYSGTAEFTNVTLKVPKGSADDPAMNVSETVRVAGVTAQDKTYDGRTVDVSLDGLTITSIAGGEDLTEALREEVTCTWYKASAPDRALSITPRDAGSYILKAAVETLGEDGALCRGEQVIPVTISKATVTITADSQSVELNGTEPKYTYTVTGLAEGDELALEPTLTCRGVDLSRNSTYTITVKGASLPLRIAGNYNAIVYQSGSLRVGTGSSGSSGGGSSQNNVVKNPDGSTTKTDTDRNGVVTETVTMADKTKVVTVTATDGSSTATVTYPTGVKAEAETTAEGVTTASVTLPAGQSSATVTIPMQHTDPGTVAVLVKEDGTEEILRWSVMTENGMSVQVTGAAQLKFVDKSNQFDDVAGDSWAASAVAYVSSRELFHGTGDNQFTPAATMTRGMLLTVLARLDGADTAAGEGETWFDKGTAWAVDKGVSNGQNPEKDVTRQELAMLLWRYAGKPGTEGSLNDFADAGAVDSAADVPMRWAVENGIISGKDGKLLDPQGTASRAEVAAMLERFVKAAI